MKKLFGIISLSVVLIFVAGCSGEGKNVNDQKQIEFSFSQQASTENWEVKDSVSGTYFNIENLIKSNHKLEITSKNDYTGENLTLFFKIGDEILSLQKEGESQQKFFKAKRTSDGTYQLKTGGFSRFDENEKLWDEKVKVVIEYGNKQDIIELN
ncbi:hypothetical protein [Lentibacillus sediminis]|uniref:hypothetical protein n=1 Tax=Lentibacillus sediminis TaxID=1940529 RepID=UPI000C1B805A|nr:hypothetical protein [Lentibacillus sediminis]